MVTLVGTTYYAACRPDLPGADGNNAHGSVLERRVSGQTVYRIRVTPGAESHRHHRLVAEAIGKHVGGAQMSIVATQAAGGPVAGAVSDETPLITSGLMDAYRKWWQSVQKVHSMLEVGIAPTDEVSQTMDGERRARQEYAAMLRSANRPVADYLDEAMAFPPLWPTPEPPAA
jgi:hypothetical protein